MDKFQKSYIMNKKIIISMSEQELKEINGGFILPLIAIVIGYTSAVASFIYNMGKDGKSGASNKD